MVRCEHCGEAIPETLMVNAKVTILMKGGRAKAIQGQVKLDKRFRNWKVDISWLKERFKLSSASEILDITKESVGICEICGNENKIRF